MRFAEVSRSAITDLGASLFTGANGYKDVLARSTTSTTAPAFDTSDPANPKLVFSDFLNLFLFDAKHQLGTVIKALQTKGQFQSLAEPNLVAGERQGSELPRRRRVPGADRAGLRRATWRSRSHYKEFGVRLNFTPVIHGDRVHLKVRPRSARSTSPTASCSRASGFPRSARAARRPSSSWWTARRSPSPA